LAPVDADVSEQRTFAEFDGIGRVLLQQHPQPTFARQRETCPSVAVECHASTATASANQAATLGIDHGRLPFARLFAATNTGTKVDCKAQGIQQVQ
jgi:hypothetical protein